MLAIGHLPVPVTSAPGWVGDICTPTAPSTEFDTWPPSPWWGEGGHVVLLRLVTFAPALVTSAPVQVRKGHLPSPCRFRAVFASCIFVFGVVHLSSQRAARPSGRCSRSLCGGSSRLDLERWQEVSVRLLSSPPTYHRTSKQFNAD